MNKLGIDLLELVQNYPEHKLPLQETLVVAMQALEILESVHRRGLIHNDVKPNNMMSGLNDPHTIYFIDFGFATKYLTDDDQHIPESEINALRSNPMYMSLNRMLGKVPSRRDDLESLAYTLM